MGELHPKIKAALRMLDRAHQLQECGKHDFEGGSSARPVQARMAEAAALREMARHLRIEVHGR